VNNPGSAISTNGESHLELAGAISILVLGLLLFALPRPRAVVPMLILACFVPGQSVAIMALNFGGIRILVFLGIVRIIVFAEWKQLLWQRMDTLLVLFAGVGSLIYIVQFGTLDALKFRLGQMFDIAGMYFLFRCFINSWKDITILAKTLAIISIFVAIAFAIERSSGHNMFAVFGGVPAITMVRDGRFRCQGAFAHPILAGCFWATLIPIMATLWWRGPGMRPWAVIGVICSLIIIVLCSSSTPVAAVMFGLIGAFFFQFRRSMRAVRWTLFTILIILHLTMQGPIWGLVARIDFAGGSTGYYRFTLIDAAIRHFSDWWLLGIQSVDPWSQDYNHYLTDITDQYVLEAVRGGIWTLVLFIAIIATAFSKLGRVRVLEERNRGNLVTCWALGVAIFVHCIIFFGVSYFGQITSIWYLTLAMAAGLPLAEPKKRRRKGGTLSQRDVGMRVLVP
jgi:hypothetical protein